MVASKTKMGLPYAFFGLFIWVVALLPTVCFGKKLPIVCSIYPVADWVRQVGGEQVDVTVVLPAGASPHTFEPKPSMLKKFSSARIFFMIGAGLEFWADKFIRLSDANLLTVVLSEGISLIHTVDHHDDHKVRLDEADATDRHAPMANPHIWLDPVAAKLMVNTITASLSEVDNGHVEYYQRRSRIYLDVLDRLDRHIGTIVESFSNKKYVSFHASWVYFARRYGLESVGVIEATPGRNPSPIQIKHIVERIKKHHIQSVFAEPQLNPKVAEVIAKEAGVTMLILDPMGGPNLPGRRSYVDLMNYNVNVLKEAME
ncbi:MAG: zinc ABC transporter substrate-binding protein [Desulfobacterales bacterium]|nr:MAG: zinc ABC transporter substrate-binding protein [Desulfobacterales bacterium]